MPDFAPAAQPNRATAPATTQTNNQGAAVAPLGVASPAPQQPAAVAPASEVAIAPSQTSGKAASVAPAPLAQPEAAIAPATFAEKVVAPATGSDMTVAPAPRSKITPDSVVPLTYRNLLCFENLGDVKTAIKQAKSKVSQTEVQFAWSRAASDPAIALTSIDELAIAVFGTDSPNFKADELLTDSINKLPKTVSSKVRRTDMHLEGLWIEFPRKVDSDSKPKLGIAVSIALLNPETQLGPFSLNPVYLKFGDFPW